jgi:hypothetical protein
MKSRCATVVLPARGVRGDLTLYIALLAHLPSRENRPGEASHAISGELMRFGFCLLPATLAVGFCLLALPPAACAQEPASGLAAVHSNCPKTPQPQFALAEAEPPEQQTPAGQSQSAPQPASRATPAQGSSSSLPAAQQPDAQKTQREKADEQIKEQEKQRTVGILPAFNVSYRSDAVSMTAGQKMKLAFRSSTDPVAFAAAFVVAGYREALDDDPGFGWGAEGYGKAVRRGLPRRL